jgi:uncharacterized repeat protein (TIGR01451 family)
MKNYLKSLVLSAVFALSTAASSSWAQSAETKSPLEFTSKVKMEQSVKAADGSISKKLVDVKTAQPGQEVIFVNTFKNGGSQPATNIALVNPVPDNMVLKSAYGTQAQITYSLDGGKNYDAPEKLVFKQSDGKTRPARMEDFTHVRWVVASSLPPGQIGEVGFRALLK